MNVYVYEGKNRFEAKNPVVEGNQQVALNTNYTVDTDSGFLIVAFPNKNKLTDFHFKYWVAEYSPTPWYEMILYWRFEGEHSDLVYLITVSVIAVLALTLLCLFFCCLNRCCSSGDPLLIDQLSDEQAWQYEMEQTDQGRETELEDRTEIVNKSKQLRIKELKNQLS